MMSIEEKRLKLFQIYIADVQRRVEQKGFVPIPDEIVDWMRNAFYAALDAVVIELPQPEEALAKSYGPMLYLEEVIDAIESTGLGIKVMS